MTVEKQVRQYGLWQSPISPGSLARGIRLSDVQWTPDGTTLVWREERSGVGVLVCRVGADAPREITDELSVRARVGYGGGDFTVADGVAYFVDQASGRIHRQGLSGGAARPVTPPFGFASSPAVSPDGRWLAFVHSSERVDRIAIVDTEGKLWPQVLASGHDFFMQPTWSADGRSVAWVAWDHPQMPWDGTRAYVATLDATGEVPRVAGEPRCVAGADDVAVFQPVFTPDGRALAYISDEGGWSHLEVRDLASGNTRTVAVDGAELGTPAWIQGLRNFALMPDGRRALVLPSHLGFVRAAIADLATGSLTPVAALEDYTDVMQPAVNPKTGAIAALATSPAVPPRVVVAEPESAPARVVRRSASESVPAVALSKPEPYAWTSLDGSTVYGIYYPPASDRFESAGRPPLVVHVHGGPTSQSTSGYNSQNQFLATRGYAVLSVNYRGSTGYGRDYMLALRGTWGICDVEDSVSGAAALAQGGRVDGSRTAIMGGSAGGFTVLQTMIVHPDAFTAGVCLFGVANQFALAAETHKFEERYTDSLLGPLPGSAAIYRERSPQYRASEIRRPIAIFQGEIDEVVPKNQSEVMVRALERSGTPHEYHVYAGEGHGWRKAETIETFYTAVERFLRHYLIFN